MASWWSDRLTKTQVLNDGGIDTGGGYRELLQNWVDNKGSGSATTATLVIVGPFQPVDKSLQARMLFVVYMHKRQAEACSIRPPHFRHFDGQRFIRCGELNKQ